MSVEKPSFQPNKAFLELFAPAPLLVLFGTLGLYLLILIPRLIWETPAGMFVGQEHLYTDWPFHIAMANRFAYCDPSDWLAQNPIYAGQPLRYSFFSAFISGMLIRGGLSTPMAIILPTLVAVLLLIPALYVFFRLILRDKWLPVVAILVFFLCGGPGFLTWLAEFGTGRTPFLELLTSPPKTYSRLDEYAWYDGNWLAGLLLPQRAFLPGIATATWVLVMLLFTLEHWDEENPKWPVERRRMLFTFGLMTGVIPILHFHSYFALGIICICVVPLFAKDSWERWSEILLCFGVPALAIGVYCFTTFLKPPISQPGFVSVDIGFTSQSFTDWFVMWWKIWGISLPVAAVGLFIMAKREPVETRWRLGVVYGGVALFALANIFRFQPIDWDNSKVFLWAYLVLSAPMAVVVVKTARLAIGSEKARPAVQGVLTTLLVVFLCGTGVVELVRLYRTDKHPWQFLKREEIEWGEMVRAKTNSNDTFLTMMDLGPWVMVSGARPVVMGFGGWMSNFGFPTHPREDDMRTMFKGGPEADRLLQEYRVRYVVIGPREIKEMSPNISYYDKHYLLFLRSDDGITRIYEIPRAYRNWTAVR